MAITCGIDVGSSSVKGALGECGLTGGEIRATYTERIRRREPVHVIRQVYDRLLEEAGVAEEDVAYVASTGEGDLVTFRRGHFYGMTTHARGAIYLDPEVRSVIDVGALHARAILIDPRSRVLTYRMTGQCASGSGQFLENIARYLGVSLDEVGPLSASAERAEPVSGICAVLAETDVINMVSRGIRTAEILRGIHESIANRLVRLLRSVKAASPVLVTGGLANDSGLLKAIRDRIREDGAADLEVRVHPESAHAGAIGAALWAGYRHERLLRAGRRQAPTV
jgi:benzoyl-CoA reductase subunit D